MCQTKVHKPKLPYLPCFTMVATGTCAFGAHCCFMHDERCLLRPKHLRKHVEHEMINHLLQYRSSKKKLEMDSGNMTDHSSSDEEMLPFPSSFMAKQHQQQVHSLHLDDDSFGSSEEYCPEFRSAASSISFSRDSFFWPQMQYTPLQIAAMSKVPYGKSKNTYSYDPLPIGNFGKYVEEMSSWYHYLSAMETNNANTVFRDPLSRWNGITNKTRLPCFQKLAVGQSL